MRPVDVATTPALAGSILAFSSVVSDSGAVCCVGGMSKTVFEVETYLIAYVVEDVQSTASSFSAPLMVNLRTAERSESHLYAQEITRFNKA